MKFIDWLLDRPHWLVLYPKTDRHHGGYSHKMRYRVAKNYADIFGGTVFYAPPAKESKDLT